MDDAVRIAFEAGLPYSGLRDFQPDARLWAAVGLDRARRQRLVPLLVIGGRLQVACARPDPDLAELESAFDGVDVVIAPAAEIDAALAQAAPASADDEPEDGVATEAPEEEPDDAPPERLGDLLLAHGATTSAEIDGALAEQERTGGLLGDVLLARGAVAEDQLLAVLAEHFALPRIDLAGAEPDAGAVALVPEELQRRLRCVPLAVDENALYVAVADPLDERQQARLSDAAGERELRCFLAARDEVDAALGVLHEARWVQLAGASTGTRDGTAAARRIVAVAILATLVAIVAGLALAPAAAAIALTAVAALLTAGPALLALGLAVAGLRLRRRGDVPLEPDDALALTTLLVPLGGGAGASVRAAGTLATLDHPLARLEVLLLCPAGDRPGLRAARELARRRPHRLVTVPESLPPTRAAMLAYGLLQARGEYVAVLRPGDVPAPQLLRAAGSALDAGGRGLAVVQAALAPPTDGPIARAWPSAARTIWHELLAPGMAVLGLPLPLSATGLVARRSALDAIGGWDVASEAEGLELGLRLSATGFRQSVLPQAIGVAGAGAPADWARAQARWWRGCASAWLARPHHAQAARTGTRAAAGSALLGTGALLTPLVWPLALAGGVAGVLTLLGPLDDAMPPLAAWLAVGQVLVVVAVLAVLGVVSGRRRDGTRAAARAAVLAPLGLVLTGCGSWLGLAQLLRGPRERPGADRKR
jgi:hypothetical protein